MNAPQIIGSQTYADEALEVIAGIMRTSASEKTRLVAAAMLLERGGDRKPRLIASGADLPAIEAGPASPPMRERVLNYMSDHYMQSFNAATLKETMALRSPVSAVGELLVTLHRENMIGKVGNGMFRALPPNVADQLESMRT